MMTQVCCAALLKGQGRRRQGLPCAAWWASAAVATALQRRPSQLRLQQYELSGMAWLCALSMVGRVLISHVVFHSCADVLQNCLCCLTRDITPVAHGCPVIVLQIHHTCPNRRTMISRAPTDPVLARQQEEISSGRGMCACSCNMTSWA